MLAGCLASFGLPVDTPPASNEPLDVGGRSGLAERQQALLSLLRGDSREGAHLGIRELAASERVSHARQCRQRACDPDALARGAKVHPDAPREPGGAGTKADVPAPAVIELTDEAQEASSRRVEMGLPVPLDEIDRRVPMGPWKASP